MRLVPVDRLRPNATIALDVMNAKNLLLIGAGSEITPKIIDKLQNVDLEFIYINDEHCTKQTGAGCLVTSDSKTMLRIIERLNQITKHINMGLASTHDMIRIQQLCYEIVEEYRSVEGDIKIVYEPVKMVINSVLEQSIYITMLSVALGMKMGLTPPQLSELCMAGLLRDFALMAPPNSPILRNVDKEDIEKEHMILAYRFLHQYSQVNRRVLDGITQHHEKFNGGGFPTGISGEDISIYSRILAMIDCFYALKSNSELMIVEEGMLEMVFKTAMTQYDPAIVKVFLENVELFTIDTLVQLTNGDVAIIIKNSKLSPFAPVVKILRSDIFEEGMELDLGSPMSFNIKISTVIYYPDEVKTKEESKKAVAMQQAN